ncbi:MAG: Gfo/Idh/MocA family protein, partial [Paracoccaceae bacterium]
MLTVGLIGAGRIGRVHASTISMHANSKLVAVADVIEDNAQKLARDFGIQVCSTDAIYKDKSIDAVLVASSTDTH